MSPVVRELSTDYLVVGAGAMGMAFLEELITSSEDIEAIIVDTRSAPGGHWNYAYSFVRLHQPALTYGLNSRDLGDGEADLASKALILEHYELGLKDLLATGRVRYFPQCRYIGDGQFVSLFDENLVYEVKIKAKLVDATCTETHVPATRKPNYNVSEGVSLMPINGLSDLNRSCPHYNIVGGGKTGIDAVLFLLDHGVNPDKISWVVPNDSWFLNRDRFDFCKGDMLKKIAQMRNAMLDDEVKTCTKAFASWEEIGVLMRLDKNIIPTRFRAATLTSVELEKLNKVHNIIRNGRIESIEPDKLIFQSGEEIKMDTETLHIDCSTNSTLFAPGKKVFDGKTINVQYIMLPPPSSSASVIAALELHFPNDEGNKNSVCHFYNPPQFPQDLFSTSLANQETNRAVIGTLGIMFQMKRRAFAVHHLQWLDLVATVYFTRKTQQDFENKLKFLIQEEI